MKCEVEGCCWGADGAPYSTPDSLDSSRQHLDMLTLHVKMKHELIPREAKPGVSTSALDSKLAEHLKDQFLRIIYLKISARDLYILY